MADSTAIRIRSFSAKAHLLNHLENYMVSINPKNEQQHNRHFEFQILNNTPHMDGCYALRYQVYCNERSYLDDNSSLNHRDTDRFDPFALQIGGFAPTGALAGTVRLIPYYASAGLPMLDHCQIDEKHQALFQNSANGGDCRVAEISRLAVSKEYFWNSAKAARASRKNEKPETGVVSHRFVGRRLRTQMVLGLYRTMYQASKKGGITHWLAAMEKPLLNLLKASLFTNFLPIGPEVDYHGPVTPYIQSIEELEQQMYDCDTALLKEMCVGLDFHLWPDCLKQEVLASDKPLPQLRAIPI
ncbi:MAG: PEP-CTERM/exosortase system-associated acyltransferase [Gammaproteobacteria bacterium]|nr:PEP-CTERM/exosortase system-associated acyltransferase [Gammaproteobacteria bacterium]